MLVIGALTASEPIGFVAKPQFFLKGKTMALTGPDKAHWCAGRSKKGD